MERLSARLKATANALNRLQEAVAKESLTEIEKDGLIQRFEFCFEILWKCGKDYLAEYEGMDIASPKKVIRSLRETRMFSDEETEILLTMVDDRNLITHTYDEEFAEKLIGKIYDYASLMCEWFERMKRAINR